MLVAVFSWRVSNSTGVGGGLAAFLTAALSPRVVTPYLYTAATKSQLATVCWKRAWPDAGGSARLTVHAESRP